jgi:hypothetical protein
MRNLISIRGEIRATFHARIFKPNFFISATPYRSNWTSLVSNVMDTTMQPIKQKTVEQWLKDSTEKTNHLQFYSSTKIS